MALLFWMESNVSTNFFDNLRISSTKSVVNLFSKYQEGFFGIYTDVRIFNMSSVTNCDFVIR